MMSFADSNRDSLFSSRDSSSYSSLSTELEKLEDVVQPNFLFGKLVGVSIEQVASLEQPTGTGTASEEFRKGPAVKSSSKVLLYLLSFGSEETLDWAPTDERRLRDCSSSPSSLLHEVLKPKAEDEV